MAVSQKILIRRGDMRVQKPSQLDKTLAKFCLKCPVCRRARWRQRGTAFWLVKKIEARMCPFCRACERVYGRKAHERRPPKD
jgi:hypothetical protein